MTSIPAMTPERYQALIKDAGLAEHSDVRGAMVIKPYGFALWEQIQHQLDKGIKARGATNAYFPLLIPSRYLSKEAQHVEGFAKECAVVTHHRLRCTPDGQGVQVDPEALLSEPLVIRPTSETPVWQAYSRWIQSYRDLPMRINQWANVVRWELRPRLFLRTTEILWQEGHTAHATAQQASAEARAMHDYYASFMEEYLAVPVIKGEKTAHERFAGAEATYTLEAMMQDGKALQLGTSHFLGQNFAKAFDVTFATPEGGQAYAWGSSWGLTTRMIGSLVMVHADERGLILPPKLAPIQAILIPLAHKETDPGPLLTYVQRLKEELCAAGVRVQVDSDPHDRPGRKYTAYEQKGVPLRLVVGARELAQEQVQVTCRDNGQRHLVGAGQLLDFVLQALQACQARLFTRALAYRTARTQVVDDLPTFKQAIADRRFVMAHWDGTTQTERALQAATQATIRCLPFDREATPGKCIYSGRPSQGRVLFAQAY